MRSAVMKVATVTACQILLFLVTIAYGMNSHAAANKASFQPNKAPLMQLAKGQAYVPPHHQDCECSRHS